MAANRSANGKGHGGPARRYSWPPFAPGHQLSTVHGAYSERSVVPLAEAIAAALLEDPETPDYLRSLSYLPAVQGWARAEAVVIRLWEFLGTQDVQEALSETITGTEEEAHGEGGRVTRRSASTRVVSVLAEVHRAEVRAMNLRSKLGLDPLSRARIMRDLGLAHQAGGEAIARLAETGREIRERREAEFRVIDGGNGDRSA